MCVYVNRTSADVGDPVEIILVTITIEADLAILGYKEIYYFHLSCVTDKLRSFYFFRRCTQN